jgi:hypothetical protein
VDPQPCSDPYGGFLPARTLGLAPLDAGGYFADAWAIGQNRIRYAVYLGTINGVKNPFTRKDIEGIKKARMADLSGATLLRVCASSVGIVAGTNCGPTLANTLADKAPALVYSVGPNAVRGGAGADEAENPNPNGGSADRIFVSHVRSGAAGAANEFDDMVLWLSLNKLFSRMVAAGRLP